MDEDDLRTERRRAEASQWFARLKSLPVSHGTLKDFFAWRREKQNAAAFEEAERFWTDAGRVSERPAILRAVENARRGRQAPRRTWRFALVPALAALAAAIVAGAVWYALSPRTFRTDIGEQRAVALDDGSRLHLNTETQVSVRYQSDARRLVLTSGEALFNVAHDTRRPFTVSAGGVTVTATGTQFDVSRIGDGTVVTLLQGKVDVAAPDGSHRTLLPGQQWQWPVRKTGIRTINAANVTAWTQGRVVFEGTSLADAVAEVNRYGGAVVILDSPALAGEPISGTFQAGDTQSFAKAVASFLPMRERRDENGQIHLVANAQ